MTTKNQTSANSYLIDSSGKLIVSNTTSILTIENPKYNCTKCKKEFESFCHVYSGPAFERCICTNCYTKAMDKLYGIDNEAEYTLYQK